MKKILALALTALVLLSICSLSVADEKKTLFPMRISGMAGSMLLRRRTTAK